MLGHRCRFIHGRVVNRLGGEEPVLKVEGAAQNLLDRGFPPGVREREPSENQGGIEILASRVIRDFPGQPTHSDASLREIPDSQRFL
jgi:hypothetical protein